MDASIAAIIGAAVGAVGGLGGGAVSALGQARSQRSQHANDRTRWRDEMRRNAYQELITTTKALARELWRASDHLLDPDSTPADWQSQYREVHEAWTHFSAATAAVTIAGPGHAAEAAEDLRTAMRDWEMIVTEWTKAAIGSGTGENAPLQERFAGAAKAKRGPDKAFQHAARYALATE